MAYADIGSLPLTGSVVWNNWMIVVGGDTATDSAYIRKALINPDGSLGAWKNIGQLTVAVTGASCTVTSEGLLYIVGGVSVESPDEGSASSQGLKTFKVQLNGDANIVSPVQELNSLLIPLVNPTVMTAGGWLYVSGGQSVLSTLAYDGQPVDFVGSFGLNGRTSGVEVASDAIKNVTDTAPTGSVEIYVLPTATAPAFLDNETIYEPGGPGRAVANGTVTAKKLDFDTQATNFSVNDIIGVFSDRTVLADLQASGTVTAQTDAGATGTLTLSGVTGDDSALTGSDICVKQGAATSNSVVYKTLAYDTQTGDFTVGLTVTGGTSGATGVILEDTDNGTDGVLKLTSVTGTFQAAEIITDTDTGSASATGAQSASKIDYTAQTQNFTTTARLFGVTSGAKAIIDADSDAGTTGTLTLSSVSGTFTSTEALVAYSAAAYASVADEMYVVLNFDGQTGYFANGEVVTGLTSGATMLVSAKSTQGGGAGTLWSQAVVGTFENNEIIAGDLLGSARADGVLVLQSQLNNNSYRAKIQADGSLGVWTSVGDIS